MKTRLTVLLLTAVLLLAVLAGCGSSSQGTAETKTSSADGRTQVTLMLDRDTQVDDIGTYLAEKYPDVDFDIVVGRTGTAYLEKAIENDDLPDIILSGDTWGRSGADLYPYLYDFSATDIASEFYTVYLDNYTTSDCAVYWLPGCAGCEGILANKALFEENNIALPTDYASFVAACEQFTALGIRPYASDYKYNYTDAYLLQCLSIPLLQSEQGKTWRLDYEEGTTDTLDETIGLQMFEKLDEFFDLTGVTADDAARGYGATLEDFSSGNVAMIRQSTMLDDYYNAGMSEDDLVLLPYFGETEDDNWYFTTPSYAVAMNGALEGTDKEDICLDIVRTLFTQPCMELFAAEYNCVTAYNKGITLEMGSQFENIVSYIDSNHMYQYLAQDTFQDASYDAVQKMIAEDASPEQALSVFNDSLVQPAEEEPTVTTFEQGYSRQWTDSGNAAMSATLNTLAVIADCDILLAPSTICPGAIYAGDYNQTELLNLLLGGGINLYKKTLTGAEVRAIVAAAVSGTGTTYDPISLSTLPGVSGCTMVVSQTESGTWQLDDLLVDGESMQDDAEYTFVYAYTTMEIPNAVLNWDPAQHDGQDIALCENTEDVDLTAYDGFIYPEQHAADLWLAYFTDGGALMPATDYIQVK